MSLSAEPDTKLRRVLGGMSIFTLLMTMLSSETPDFGTKIVKYDNLAWSDPELASEIEKRPVPLDHVTASSNIGGAECF